MGSLRRRAQCAVALITLVTVALAQPAREPAAGAASRERQILDRLEQERAQNGLYSAGLIVPLSELAVFYRENGDDGLAVTTIETLLEVVRRNDGVYSLDQVPWLQQLIAIEESEGNPAAAWNLEQRLLTLARRYPDDLRTVPVLRAAAERRAAILARYQAGEFPPQLELGCYAGWPRTNIGGGSDASTCKSVGSKRDISRAIVSDAQKHFAEAIAVLLRNDEYANEELRALETRLIDTIVAEYDMSRWGSLIDVDTLVEPWQSWSAAVGEIARVTVPNPTGLPLVPSPPPDSWRFDYLMGRESVVRQYAYELAVPAPLSVQIEAFLRIADWDLLHSQNARALGEYEQVYRLLAERGARALIDDLFSPPMPVVLPAHRANPLATPEAAAYIDVAFEVTRFGESRNIEIRDATASATQADKDGLVNLIKSSRFRPRAHDDEPARASPVVVRYYLSN